MVYDVNVARERVMRSGHMELRALLTPPPLRSVAMAGMQ